MRFFPFRPLSIHTALPALFACGLLLAYSLAGLSIWVDHEVTYRRGVEKASALAVLMEEHVNGILDAVDQLLQRTEVMIGQRDPSELAAAAHLWSEMHVAAASLPYVDTIRIFDADGRAVLISDQFPTLALSVAGEPFFTMHRDGAAYVTGALAFDRVSKIPVFERSLRLNDQYGGFAGAVVATLDTRYFTQLYHRARYSDRDAMGLMTTDGRLLVREPADLSLVGRSLAHAPLVREYLPRSPTGVFEQNSLIDGVRRIWAYRKLDEHGLVAVTSVALDSHFASWRSRVRWTITFLLCGTVAVSVLFAVAMRGERREVLSRAALAAANDRHVAVMQASPVPIVTVDSERQITGWNQAAERTFRHSADDAMGGPMGHVLRIVPENGAPAPRDSIFTDADGGAGRELRMRRGDGTACDVLLFSAPFAVKANGTSGTVCIFDDVTERRRLAEKIQQAQKMEALGQLTGGIAHDFNNLLSVILGSLDGLEDYLGDTAAARELRESAIEAAVRGAELTRSLLAFARSQPLQPTLVDVREQLNLAFRMLGRTLGEQISVKLNVPEGLWPVLVDPVQFASAIANLAINARDAMPKGGTLIVEARNVSIEAGHADLQSGFHPGQYVSIEITDSGDGMPPEVLARAFEPFFTTKSQEKGTGLGLSMVYGFVKQSGGHVRIYSEPEFGTTVFLYFPAAIATADESATAARARTELAGGTETVLVVEDNAGVRATAVRLLRSLGYDVLEAPDGPSALAEIEVNPSIDLLLTDIVMPHGMSGFDLAAAATKRRPSLKVIYSSGFPGNGTERLGRSEAKGCYLAKPYRKDELARVVRSVLDAPSPANSTTGTA